ncbi:hypothetical protein [Neisseria iguanae]|uniref:hypothetical protein n=1 Tax=Neisseria iguanae TaxID=90242 RepID=UPI00147637A9|nr:hypothetical protein [Neisseria iguanae]
MFENKDGGCPFEPGYFVDAAKAFSGQLRLFNIVGDGLFADFRIVWRNGISG